MENPRWDLLDRTADFSVMIIRLFSSLPKTTEAQVLGKQLLRSGTSVGAHMREARRSRSDSEMLSKIEGGLQELEESRYWLELLERCGIAPSDSLASLNGEARELTAILVTSSKKLRARKPPRK